MSIDLELADLLEAEVLRQRTTLSMIASENIVSDGVLHALQSALTNKTVEGAPGRRYHAGGDVADMVERLAAARAQRLFGAVHANVQCHSGTSANQAALASLAPPGARLLSMALAHGGHLSHGHRASSAGALYQVSEYLVDPRTDLIDLDAVRAAAHRERPQVIVAGASSYPRDIDYAGFAAIAREVGALLMVDVAHFAGPIASGRLPSPMPHADIVTMSTYKSLRGPRGGIVLCRDAERGAKVDRGVFPYAQGTPAMNAVAAKAVCLFEAAQPEFRRHCADAIAAAKSMASLLQESGVPVLTGGTDTSMVIVDLREAQVSGADVTERLARVGLLANRNLVPRDPRKPSETSGVRLSTAGLISRGVPPCEIARLAQIVVAQVRGDGGEAASLGHAATVRELCQAYPLSERGTRLALHAGAPQPELQPDLVA